MKNLFENSKGADDFKDPNNQIMQLSNFFKEKETEVQEASNSTAEIVIFANSLEINNVDTYTLALEMAKECNKRIDRIEKLWENPKRQAYELHKSITQTINKLVEPLKEAKRIIDRKALLFKAEEEKKKEQEKEKLLKEIENLEAAGAAEEAQALIKTIETQDDEFKVSGVSIKENWQFEIIDEAKIPREYLTPDLNKIRQVVKALKEKANIPGIKVYNAGSIAYRKN